MENMYKKAMSDWGSCSIFESNLRLGVLIEVLPGKRVYAIIVWGWKAMKYVFMQ